MRLGSHHWIVGDEGGGAHPGSDEAGVGGEQAIGQSADVEVDRRQPWTEPSEWQGRQEQRPALNSEAPCEESTGRCNRDGDPPPRPRRGLADFAIVTVGECGEPRPDGQADDRAEDCDGSDEDQVSASHSWDPCSFWCR